MSQQKIFKLDENDKKIIDALLAEPELNFSQLSEKLGIPKTTVHNKFKKLEEEKIIRKSIKVDRNFLFGDVIVFILIQIVGADQKQVLNQLMNFKEVEEAAIVTGEMDMILRLRLENIYQLNTFILENLRTIQGIANSTSMISLQYSNKNDKM